MAIQSGVPIVPVVIHNSGDISPKGDKIFRSGTVNVDVLPAIETTDWSVANIDDHVADVRNASCEPWVSRSCRRRDSQGTTRHT